MHIKLDTPDKSPTIDEKTAIENAKNAFPGWAQDATEVKAEYQKITNDNFQGFSKSALAKNPDLKEKGHMDKLPVYIVSFKGMTYYGHVPQGYTDKVPVHHEYNVVVDATTGEPLMGFSYR